VSTTFGYLYIYVYIYICIYSCIHIHIYISIYIHIYIYVDVCEKKNSWRSVDDFWVCMYTYFYIYTWICSHIFIYTCIYIDIYVKEYLTICRRLLGICFSEPAHTHTHWSRWPMGICIHMYTYIYMYASILVYICTCMQEDVKPYVHTHIQTAADDRWVCVYTCIHIYTCTQVYWYMYMLVFRTICRRLRGMGWLRSVSFLKL